MKTLKERIHNLLTEKPEARERRNRARVIRYFIRKDVPGAKDLSDETIDAIAGLSDSVDRLVRMAQMNDEALRGTDYEDKTILSQQKQIALGYQPGFRELVR